MERLFDMAEHQASMRPGGIMFAAKIKGAWQTLTCKEVVQKARDLAAGLLEVGINNASLEPEKAEKIALISNNRPEWLITDLGIQQTGAILTPIYPTVSPEDFAYIMNEAEVRTLFIANQELYDRFRHAFAQIPTLQYVYSFDPIEGVRSWNELTSTLQGENRRQEVVQRINAQSIATIIYTSGTTGKPKGVMLSHKNIASNVRDCMPVFHFARQDDRALSFLPLNHIFEKTVSYVYINAGLSIYYAESMDTIGDNLREVKPMVFTCVPRLLEKVYERIMGKGHELSGVKKMLFFWAVDLAKKYDNVHRGNLLY
jgi:long-chain acyl-CoA synthetase